MEEEITLIQEDASENMQKAITHLEKILTGIRAGKADPNMLQGINIDYYGVMTPINQAASILSPDSRTITIQPWEKDLISVIEKAILSANIGLTPANNGEVIRLILPPLTEERRKDLVKQVRGEGENAKISIRNIRKDANNNIKLLEKDGLAEDLSKNAMDQIQQLTDKFTKIADEKIVKKEDDIMKI